MSEATKLFSDVGVAIGMLILTFGALAIIVRWTALNLVQPALARHFRLMDALEAHLQQQTNTLSLIEATLKRHESLLCRPGRGGLTAADPGAKGCSP